ncbi:MAG TPA: HAMP domain-containing sensor histidine kinase [Geopsychrobacteraceae bacterium]|nr:HAMP domain-containing sensor histidine kinase [Geopsychrobacteraceae bacterium]
MNLFRRIFHPLIAFIGIQLLWLFLLVSWIYWFLGRHQQLKELAARYQTEHLAEPTDWLILAEGIVLLVAILVGVYVIFLYWRRQAALNRAQTKFISQVSHELKSPLASIQLHLETIEIRQPEPAQLQHFVRLMQEDTDRLNGLITNLLAAGRLEHKSVKLALQVGDLSQMISEYLQQKKKTFPEDGLLSWDIEPQLLVKFDTESLEIVLRNLLENAALYTDGAPQVNIRLSRDKGKAHLVFSDRGHGIDTRYRKKVFRMFYRIRQSGKTIRGSGIGLFIVRSIVRRHGGDIWLESQGNGQGTTFHLTFPLHGKKDTDK